MTAVESSVQDIKGSQQEKWQKAMAALVDEQLEEFVKQTNSQVDKWVGPALKACQDMEVTLEGMQKQLQDIEQCQRGLRHANYGICQRLDHLETSGLRTIMEETPLLERRTADSARSVLHIAVPRSFAETRDEWEKRVASTEKKKATLSHASTVLQEPFHVVAEEQESV